jgi:hypothetical protein
LAPRIHQPGRQWGFVMSVRGIVLALSVPILTFAASGAHPAPNLVQNGDFESSSYKTSSQFGTGYGGEGVSDWTAGGGYQVYFFYSTATTVSAASEWGEPQMLPQTFNALGNGGTAFIGLDADPDYSSPLQQTIGGLTVGRSYDVSFDWGATQLTNRTGDTTERVRVSLIDNAHDTTVAQTTNTDSECTHCFSGWQAQTFRFTATSSSEVLSFLAQGTPNGLPPFVVLDNVSMTEVPEPAAWALMIVGLAGLGGVARKHRNLGLAPVV